MRGLIIIQDLFKINYQKNQKGVISFPPGYIYSINQADRLGDKMLPARQVLHLNPPGNFGRRLEIRGSSPEYGELSLFLE